MNANAIEMPDLVTESIDRFALSKKVNELLADKSQIKLLEAGCGSFSHINVKPFVKAVGIDISQEQLDKNADLDEKILGDIQTYPLPENEFDVIVCWFVIEHLARPEDALRNMFKALRPGGLLILTFPNILSIKGLVTKYTPHWFHTLIYRVMKFQMRPFKTYCRWSIIPRRVVRFAQQYGLSPVFWRMTEDEVTERIRERLWPMKVLFGIANGAAKALSFGKCTSVHLDNCDLILQKKAG